MPYWNKYPLRDRAGDRGKPAATLTSRGMGVPERVAASLRENAEAARLAAEKPAPAEADGVATETERTRP